MEEKTSSPKKKVAGKRPAKLTPSPPPAAQSQPLQPAKPKEVKKLLGESVQQYRVKIPLAKGQKIIGIGSLTGLAWMDEVGIQRLIKTGAVRVVLSPPLSELAGWKTRAKRLEPVGVVTMADFLTVDAADLARVLRAKRETVIGWQDQLRDWSKSEEPSRR